MVGPVAVGGRVGDEAHRDERDAEEAEHADRVLEEALLPEEDRETEREEQATHAVAAELATGDPHELR